MVGIFGNDKLNDNGMKSGYQDQFRQVFIGQKIDYF